jgi:tetratricopeptide (TPR) repeat protein
VKFDAAALGLIPLKLKYFGEWDPSDHYWGEQDEPVEKWAEPIIARGPRPSFEMEQVLPGQDPEDFDSDPIIEAVDLKDAGEYDKAIDLLMGLCQSDLRCLDAHAHLGSFATELSPAEAIRHYAVGVGLGELSLGRDFTGLLPWGLIDNRPFLRCLNGLGLCARRLGRFDEAERIFTRLLWLNPTDNQGARCNLAAVEMRQEWEPDWV